MLQEIKRYPFMPETKIEMSAITARNFSLSIGTKKLIESSDFTLGAGEKITLIGRNGSGKSTLFETIYRIHKKLPFATELAIEGVLEISPQ